MGVEMDMDIRPLVSRYTLHYPFSLNPTSSATVSRPFLPVHRLQRTLGRSSVFTQPKESTTPCSALPVGRMIPQWGGGEAGGFLENCLLHNSLFS